MSKEAGKGSKRRPTNQDTYGSNYDNIFKKKQMNINNYRLVKAEDGITWVSLEPLAYDINKILSLLMDIPTDDMDQDAQAELNFRIHGLKAVHSFIAALLTEQNVNELREKNEAVH